MKTPLTFLQGIILVIIIAIIGLVTLIIISQSNDFGMVEKNYYETDLKYQEQIERIARTDALPEKIVFEQTPKFIEIKFPAMFNPSDISGEIVLYRPSNPNLDQLLPLKLDNNNDQIIDVTNFECGAWLIKLNWTYQDLEYYTEKRIYINN